MGGNSISITNSILRFFEKIQPILIPVNALSHFPSSGMKWRLILTILIPPVLFLLFWQEVVQFMVTFRQVPFPGPVSVIRELFSIYIPHPRRRSDERLRGIEPNFSGLFADFNVTSQ